MSSEYVREIEDAFGVNPAPRQSARLVSDLEAIEPFDEMTGPMPEYMPHPTEKAKPAPSFRELGLSLYRDGAKGALDLIEKGLSPTEIREWIGRLA